MYDQVRPYRPQLRFPPQAARTYAPSVGQILNGTVLDRAECIPWILTHGYRCDLEFRRKFGWQVFKAMNSQIHTPVRQGLFNLLGEHSLRSDFGKGYIGDFVAGGVDDLDLDLVALAAQKRRNVLGLPESELRSAGAYLQTQALILLPAWIIVGVRRFSLQWRWSFIVQIKDLAK